MRMGVAIIGSGYWGVNYVRTFSELPESPHVVVCDLRPERLYEIGRRFPRVELASKVEEVVRRGDIDAVVIATPASAHFEIAKLALEADKHVLVEKPITTISEDAERLVDIADERQLVLMVGHTFIHNPAVQRVKSYMERGDIGKLYYLYARRTNMGPIRTDVNALWDLAPHDIAIFDYLVGAPPQWVSAVGAKVLGNGREDVGFISLGYPEGVIAHIHVSWSDPNKVRETVVVGSDRRIVFNDLNIQEPVRVYEKGVRTTHEADSYGEHQLQMRDGDVISPRIDMGEPLKNQCRHFLDCVARGYEPLTTAKDGLEVVKVMEAIDHSLALYGAPLWVRAGLRKSETQEAPQDRAEVAQEIAHPHMDIEVAVAGAQRNGHNGKHDGENGR